MEKDIEKNVKKKSVQELKQLAAEEKYRREFIRNSEPARAICKALLRCSCFQFVVLLVQNDIRKYGMDRIEFALVNLIRKQIYTNNAELLSVKIRHYALRYEKNIPETLLLTFYNTLNMNVPALNIYAEEFLTCKSIKMMEKLVEERNDRND